MRLFDWYEVNKQKYCNYVILIKSGNFYETFGEECYILNNLFNYKIKEYNYGPRVGFPVVAYTKVITKLNTFKINYLVLDKFEVVTKKKFNKNTYNNYLTDDLSIETRIFKIHQNLNNLKNSPKIHQVLDTIEEVL